MHHNGELIIGPMKLEYVVDDGTEYPIVKEIANIIGDNNVVIIKSIKVDLDCDENKLLSTFNTFLPTLGIIAKSKTILYDKTLNVKSPHIFEDYMMVVGRMIGISNLCPVDPNHRYYIFGIGDYYEKIRDYAAAKLYMDCADNNLEAICRFHINGLLQNVDDLSTLGVSRDHLVSMMNESLNECIHKFNKWFEESIISGQENQDE